MSEQQTKADNKILESRIAESNSELREINKDLENFIFAVTHDLRVPLHNLKGLSAVVQEELANTEGIDEAVTALQMIGENAQKMDNLVTDLLAFSKTSKVELKKTVVDMGAIVQSSFDEQIALFNDKKVALKLGFLPKAFGDPSVIQQVCQNIINNALKYASNRELIQIEVSGEVRDDMAVYQFKDNGIGFDPLYSNKLFMPFQRLHHAEEFEGTGIGLATSQRIIHKHGGEIWAEGKPNEGAIFFFSLPVANN